MNANDGGPAFPVNEKNADGTHYHTSMGMSLRDYFAAMAMQGMLACGNPADIGRPRDVWTGEAYVIADHMLAAREAK